MFSASWIRKDNEVRKPNNTHPSGQSGHPWEGHCGSCNRCWSGKQIVEKLHTLAFCCHRSLKFIPALSLFHSFKPYIVTCNFNIIIVVGWPWDLLCWGRSLSRIIPSRPKRESATGWGNQPAHNNALDQYISIRYAGKVTKLVSFIAHASCLPVSQWIFFS